MDRLLKIMQNLAYGRDNLMQQKQHEDEKLTKVCSLLRTTQMVIFEHDKRC